MYEVLENTLLAPNLHRMVVRAERIAAARKAGQFVIVHADAGAERIPLTIGDADPERGTITLFVQAIGASTQKIVAGPPPRVSAGGGGGARPARLKPGDVVLVKASRAAGLERVARALTGEGAR